MQHLYTDENVLPPIQTEKGDYICVPATDEYSFLKLKEIRLVKLCRRPRWIRILYSFIYFWKVLKIGKGRVPRRSRLGIAWQQIKYLCKTK